MPQLPSKTIGDSHGERDFNKLVDFAKSLRPMRGTGVKTIHTIYGVSRKASRTKRGGGSTQLAIRGEYGPGISYKLYDIVIISTGDFAGTYVWINSSPGGGIHPSTGSPNWMQLPMGTVGAWI